MNCTNECRFCLIAEGKRNLGKVDTPIIEDANYMLLSSVGAMIEGWTLVIPKEHGYSMRKYYNNDEFSSFFSKAVDLISKRYADKKVFLFEHGANSFGSLTSCGTNHSHLHIIPSEFYILNEIKKELDFQIIKLSDLEEIVKDSEYLMYCEMTSNSIDENTECYVHILKEPISQFFRKIIANKLGIPEQYDYKTNMNIDIAEKTYDVLKED